ncbi:MAG: glycoside hydrolase family 2 protein [Opitutaceae bacterium]
MKQVVSVDQGWKFRQRGATPEALAANWLSAVVPGDVHLDLLRNRLIPDPFYRDNEAKLQWIGETEWEYRTTISATPELLKRGNIELVFEGLDTSCEVYLNDQLVLAADNMFRLWRVNAKPWLKAGNNRLLIVFPPPNKAAGKVAAADSWRAQTGVEVRTYVRKAAYEYGWDWGPAYLTSGIWRPVWIEAWDMARISDMHIRQTDVTAEVARLAGEVEVTASAGGVAEVTLQYQEAGRAVQVKRQVMLIAGLNHIEFPLELRRPELWFPTGYGAQPLYTFAAQLKLGSQTVDERKVRTGLRRVELRREADKWGRSFEFVINGIPVFAKGANMIPMDNFPSRVNIAHYRRLLESAKAANMNMIRHWGGGYYETDEFYSMCDEMGLMVWQDFMFACFWQPGIYPFKMSVAQEAEDQLRRLRNHPSIVLWCGNNEVEGSMDYIKAHSSFPITTKAEIQMWKQYLPIFHGLLAVKVKEFSAETPYWASSPGSEFEEASDTYQTGDNHDYSRMPFLSFESRFFSEYGFQSYPEMRTIESFTLPEDRSGILTPVMLAHQKSGTGNELIRKYMLKDYSEPKDFASFVYASQVVQAEGLKIGAEYLRRDRPRCMGSLYWQLNDCWPVASWSSIDYYGRWKALQYYARRFYAPLLVSPHLENDSLAVYVVSDRTLPVAAELKVRVMAFDGTILYYKNEQVQVSALSSKVYLQTGLDKLMPGGTDTVKVCVVADLSVEGKVISRNLVYLHPTKQIHLPVARIAAEVFLEGDTYRVRLSSDLLARSVQLSFGALGVEPSDNYFDLLPGEPVDIQIKGAASLDEIRKNLAIRSLEDAFETDPKSAALPSDNNRHAVSSALSHP